MKNIYKPKITKEKFFGKRVYIYQDKKYVKNRNSPLCNALEGFIEIKKD